MQCIKAHLHQVSPVTLFYLESPFRNEAGIRGALHGNNTCYFDKEIVAQFLSAKNSFV